MDDKDVDPSARFREVPEFLTEGLRFAAGRMCQQLRLLLHDVPTSGSRPHFLELERVIFRQPVQIGDLLRLAAHVTYTTMEPRPIVHIEVLASVVNPEKREAVVSNIFNFTFTLNLHLEAAHNRTMKAVVPATEGEARKYLNGKKFVQDNLHGI